jgi:NTP pyrophosphatase (non-canonical NTP hydrolase)
MLMDITTTIAMTGAEYQRRAMLTRAGDLTPTDYLINAALGLTGESGEVADHIKKHFHQGHPLNADKLIEELGDVLWYAAELAEELGVTLDLVMQLNLKKLESRYNGRFSVERSLNRV